jgi:hypothetical protein
MISVIIRLLSDKRVVLQLNTPGPAHDVEKLAKPLLLETYALIRRQMTVND